MRFIFTDNYFYIRGGAERVFFDEINLLKSYGHEVAFFSRHFNKNLFSEYSQFFASDFKYENVPIMKKISAAFKLIYSYECRNKFDILLRLVNPDVIHAHNIYGRLTTSIIDVAKKRRIPVVMTLHDFKLICPSYLMLFNAEVCEKCGGKKFYYCVAKRCHKGSLIPSFIYTVETYYNSLFKKYDWVRYFICPSKFLLRKHAETGIPEEKLIYIPNFIKPEEFTPNFNPGKYILFAGRLSKEKGVLTLLKAVKGLNLLLRIVGDGPMRITYETYAKENKITNVVFEGYKSGEELKNLFKNAIFLVFPSEWYENAPMSILEAFAYGKPVVGSNIGGISEMVIENKTGLLFNPRNNLELRERINFLLSHPSLITQLGKNAREKIEKEYNSETHYERLMGLYTNICS